LELINSTNLLVSGQVELDRDSAEQSAAGFHTVSHCNRVHNCNRIYIALKSEKYFERRDSCRRRP